MSTPPPIPPDGGAPRPEADLPPGVRQFRSGDEDPILAAMLAAHGRGELPGVHRQYLEESVARVAAEPQRCAVAEDDGRLAGLGGAPPRRPHG